MQITKTRVHIRNEEKLKAFVTFTLDDVFVVHNAKIIQGKLGLILVMPSRQSPDGTFRDVAHPINPEFRHALEAAAFAAYKEEASRIAQSAEAAKGAPGKESLKA